MKNLLFLLLGIILLFGKLNAAAINLDIYGVDLNIRNKIISGCKDNISKYVDLQRQLNLAQQSESQLILKKKFDVEKLILKKINALGDFIIVKISTVYYPQDKSTYTTIDIVKRIDAYRLPISSKRLTKNFTAIPADTLMLKKFIA